MYIRSVRQCSQHRRKRIRRHDDLLHAAGQAGVPSGLGYGQADVQRVSGKSPVRHPGMSTDSETSALPAFDDEVTTGIYNATVTLRLGGKESDLLQLIEDLSNSDKKIRVCNYSWSEERSITNLTEEGEYDIKTERVLTLTLEIYMYEEVPDDGNAQ